MYDFANLNVLNYLYDNDCPYDYTAADDASYNGNIKVFEFLKKIGCEMRSSMYDASIRKGNFSALEWIYNNGIKIENKTLRNIPYVSDPINMLSWFIRKSIPLDTLLFNETIKQRNLSFLKHLVEKNCPMDFVAFIKATNNDDIQCLNYLKEINCPFHFKVISVVSEKYINKNIDVYTKKIIAFRWLYENYRAHWPGDIKIPDY